MCLFSTRAQLEARAKKGRRVKAKTAGSMACSHAFTRRRGSSATRQEARVYAYALWHGGARPTIGSRDYGASQLVSRSLYIWKLEFGNWKLEMEFGNWKVEIGMVPIGHRT